MRTVQSEMIHIRRRQRMERDQAARVAYVRELMEVEPTTIQDVYKRRLAHLRAGLPMPDLMLVSEKSRYALFVEAKLLPSERAATISNPQDWHRDDFRLFNIRISTINQERR